MSLLVSAVAMIDETYVLAAAKALDLAIAPEHLPGVVANLQRIEAIYELLDAIALGTGDEAAPVWMP